MSDTPHIANAEAWLAACIEPDYCEIAGKIVHFDTTAVLSAWDGANDETCVRARSVHVYREGDRVRGVQGNAGRGILSGVSLAKGHVLITEGEQTVRVRGRPVARDTSYCLINTSATGSAGALGRIYTLTLSPDDEAPPPPEPAPAEQPSESRPADPNAQQSPPPADEPMPELTAKGTADQTDVALVREELRKIPPEYRQLLKDNKIKVVVVRNSVTEWQTGLRGEVPRNWGPGMTWDNVPGSGGNPVVIATRGHGTPAGAHVPLTGDGHGSYNLVLHEVAHALRRITGDPDEFIAARTADLGALPPYQLAENGGIDETYAESFGNHFGGNERYKDTHPHLDEYWKSKPKLEKKGKKKKKKGVGVK